MRHDKKITPIILAGGIGARLAPLSTPENPKQFLPLLPHQTPFQAALTRASHTDLFLPCRVIGGALHIHHIQSQARTVGVTLSRIIAEPIQRNTAAAIAAAVMELSPDTIVLIMPSDHDIPDKETFLESVIAGQKWAALGHIVTFGIYPTHPHTGYGYIKKGEQADGAFRVAAFTEKPPVTMAEAYLQSGDYLWNAGIFMARVDGLTDAFQTHAPEILKACKAAWENRHHVECIDVLNSDCFAACPAMPFDKAIMEKTDNAMVIPASFVWRDMGDGTVIATRNDSKIS